MIWHVSVDSKLVKLIVLAYDGKFQVEVLPVYPFYSFDATLVFKERKVTNPVTYICSTNFSFLC